jgi:hypothetical protein
MKAKVIFSSIGFVLSVVNVVIAAKAAGYFLNDMTDSAQSLKSNDE